MLDERDPLDEVAMREVVTRALYELVQLVVQLRRECALMPF